MANEANRYAALEKLFKEHYGNPVFKAEPDANFLTKLGARIYNTGGTKAHLFNKMKLLPEAEWTPERLQQLKESMMHGANTPFSTEALRNNRYIMKDGTEEVLKRTALGDTMGVLGQNIKAHPGAAFGTALNTGAGIAGLLDNEITLTPLLKCAFLYRSTSIKKEPINPVPPDTRMVLLFSFSQS